MYRVNVIAGKDDGGDGLPSLWDCVGWLMESMFCVLTEAPNHCMAVVRCVTLECGVHFEFLCCVRSWLFIGQVFFLLRPGETEFC